MCLNSNQPGMLAETLIYFISANHVNGYMSFDLCPVKKILTFLTALLSFAEKIILHYHFSLKINNVAQI